MSKQSLDKTTETVSVVDEIPISTTDAEKIIVTGKDGEEIERLNTANDHPPTTKLELWAYALYYFANNSSGPSQYTPVAVQNIFDQGGYDADIGPGNPCTDTTTRCFLDYGKPRSIDSVVLVNSGIGFCLQTVIILWLGGFADYGSSGTYVLLGLSLLTWGSQYAFIGVKYGYQWKGAAALSILSNLGYQLCQSFWTAEFPTLARNVPEMQELEIKLRNGEITEDEYAKKDEYWRNKICNYSWAFSNLGMILVFVVAIGILFGLHSRDSPENNTNGTSAIIAWANSFFIVFAIPWFLLKKKRVARQLPEGTNYFLLPFKQLSYGFRSLKTLKQTALYLFSYWLLGDSFNTSISIAGVLNNETINYDMVQVQYITILNAGVSILGMIAFWLVQKQFKLQTKTMFIINAFFLTLFPLYGLIGSWTQRIGFHNVWEVYWYNAYFGFFMSPYYAYSSTMMSCVCPRGKEFLFFSMFSTINKTSSFIGPFVTSAIIDRTGNTNTGFSFTFGLSVLSLICVSFLSEEKSRVECEQFLLDEDRRIKEGEKIMF